MGLVLRRRVVAGTVAVVAAAATAAGPLAPAGAVPARVIPGRAASAAMVAGRAPLFGVTADTIGHLGSTVSSLAALPEKPATRVYFDVREPARYYAAAVRRIGRVSAVMGELLDSSDEKAITVAGFQARVESYLHTLGRQVSIWEIGQ